LLHKETQCYTINEYRILCATWQNLVAYYLNNKKPSSIKLHKNFVQCIILNDFLRKVLQVI